MATGIKPVTWTLITFLDMVFGDDPRPQMKWEIDNDKGVISLRTSEKPKWVRLNWVESYNKTRRDFRIASADNPCTSLFVSGFCAQPNLYQTEKV